jgi:hypothetical protein
MFATQTIGTGLGLNCERRITRRAIPEASRRSDDETNP